MKDQRDIRNDYGDTALRRQALNANPIEQFDLWLNEAKAAGIYDYTAMTLATLQANQQPSARVVLLKHFDHTGFCWYTDYRSQKGQDLAHHPQAALLFYWPSLHRQVRIQGTVDKLSRASAEEYFSRRPENSRFSAAASEQSAPTDSREQLEQQVERLHQQYPENEQLPCPEHWGGYRLSPTHFEFWQGRSGRLHDRFVYQPNDDQRWSIQRLQP